MDNFTKVLENMVEQENSSLCPFCGASANNIDTWKYTKEYSKDFEIPAEEREKINYVKNINPTQYFCNICKNAWVIDKFGNAYSIDISSDIDGNNNSVTKEKDSEKNNSSLPSVKTYDNGYRIPLNLKYFWSPQMESCGIPKKLKRKNKNSEVEHLESLKQLSELRKNKNKITSTSMNKQVIFEDNTYKIARIENTIKLTEMYISDVTQKADNLFGFKGKLSSYVYKSDNPSKLEQQISRYFKTESEIIIETFIHHLSETLPEDADNIQLLYEVLKPSV